MIKHLRRIIRKACQQHDFAPDCKVQRGKVIISFILSWQRAAKNPDGLLPAVRHFFRSVALQVLAALGKLRRAAGLFAYNHIVMIVLFVHSM